MNDIDGLLNFAIHVTQLAEVRHRQHAPCFIVVLQASKQATFGVIVNKQLICLGHEQDNFFLGRIKHRAL